MQRITSNSAKALLVTTFLTFAPAAYAFDSSGNDLADALMADLEATGATEVTIGSVSGGGNAEILDVSAKVTADGEAGMMTIARVAFEDGMVADGVIKADQMTMEGLKIVADDVTVTMGSMVANDVAFPTIEAIKAAGEDALGSEVKYSRAEAKNLVIADNEIKRLPIESVTVEIGEYVGDIPKSFMLNVTGIGLTKEMLDAEGQKMFGMLGYENVNLSVTMDGAWDDGAGIGEIKNLTLSADDVGKLSMMARIGGLTPDVIAQLKALENEKSPEKAMGLLQGLTVEGLSVRFDNDSVVERALDAQAKQMGTDRDALAAQLAGALPLMLAALQNPEFQQKVATAAGTFLKERKAIVATANPPAPVPVAQIVGTAMVAPQTIPNVLGVELSND
ncbi:MAG: hypothetical protein C0606_01760 [Hyphomicrobiales bacterium]|nr:MAG: hypothetical protein C0606_01760 [Hyphomicrobiales bacterium]